MVLRDRNLIDSESPDIDWSTGDLRSHMEQLCSWAERQASGAVAWYYKRKEPKRRGSRGLRLGAILFLSVGALIPLLVAAGLLDRVPGPSSVGSVGYVAFGLGAACIAIDKLFGLSSGWMRFVSAAMAIEKEIVSFRFDRIAFLATNRQLPLNEARFLEMLGLVKRFRHAVLDVVANETDEWILEFKSNFARLEAQLTRAREAPVVAGVSVPPAALPGYAPATTQEPGRPTPDDIARALSENREKLLLYENVEAVGLGLRRKDGQRVPAIIVHVRTKVTDTGVVESLERRGQLIPRTVPYRRPSGQVIEIPVDVIPSGRVRANSGLAPGSAIQNQDPRFGAGTAGCLVRNPILPKHMVLTCYHAVNAGHPWPWLQPVGRETVMAVVNSAPVEIGRLAYGIRSPFLDVALVELNDGVEYSPTIPGIGTPTHAREVSWDDVFQETSIRIKGKSAPQPKVGIVVNRDVTATIEYPDGSTWRLKALFAVADVLGNTHQAITVGGDSGAAVVDDGMAVLGMVVAAGDHVTYAIPMTTILDQVGAELVTEEESDA